MTLMRKVEGMRVLVCTARSFISPALFAPRVDLRLWSRFVALKSETMFGSIRSFWSRLARNFYSNLANYEWIYFEGKSTKRSHCEGENEVSHTFGGFGSRDFETKCVVFVALKNHEPTFLLNFSHLRVLRPSSSYDKMSFWIHFDSSSTNHILVLKTVYAKFQVSVYIWWGVKDNSLNL